MECNKDEALRAKEIAERKFTEKDIAGARKFALKAQNLYPSLDGISQMLATVDVHFSAASKIGGEMNWYGILGLTHLADDEAIKKQYRKLALQLHPDKNKAVGANDAFQFVKDAFTFLSDKFKRATYDQRIRMFQSVKLPSYTGFATGQTFVGQQAGFSSGQPFVGQQTGFSSGQPFVGQQTGFSSGKHFGGEQTASASTGATSNAKSVPLKNPTQHCFPTETSANAKPNQQAPSSYGVSATAFSGKKSKSKVPKQSNCSTEPLRPTANGDQRTSRLSSQSGRTTDCRDDRGFIASQRTATFWTKCDGCKMQYEYVRGYLNQFLLCQHCKLGFKATEAAAPSCFTTSLSWIGQQPQKMSPRSSALHGQQDPVFGHSNTHGGPSPGVASCDMSSAASIAVGGKGKKQQVPEMPKRKQDDAKTGFGLKRSHDPSFSAERQSSSKKKRDVEDTLVRKSGGKNKRTSMQGASNGKKEIPQKQTVAAGEKHLDQTPLPKKSRSSASGVEIQQAKSQLAGATIPDTDFHDFDEERTENCFNSNQIWALYDKEEGMPRCYGIINELVSLRPFKVRMSWLESRTTNKMRPSARTCGEFVRSKSCSTKKLTCFSHKVTWMKNSRGVIRIYPMKGDIWALYRNWSPDWNEDTPEKVKHAYEIVEVLNDFTEEHGVSVAPIIKADGFCTVFHRQQDIVKRILKDEIFRFSHQVPAHSLPSDAASNIPQGSMELDPAATPLEYLLN